MKPLPRLILGFMAAWLLKESTGIVSLYAPALIFPLFLPFASPLQRIVYFVFSVCCYTLIIVGIAILGINILSLALAFFFSAAMMYVAYGILAGFEDCTEGLKPIFSFTIWYSFIIFMLSLLFHKDYFEAHIIYIIVPAWYWVAGRETSHRQIH